MRFEVRDKRLTPVGNWLGGTRQEVVNGYNAGVYDMSGHCYTRFKQKAEYRALASGRAARMTYEVRRGRSMEGVGYGGSGKGADGVGGY